MTVTTDVAALQRRTLRVLVAAQVFSGAGLAAGVTVGALLAQDMLGSAGWAGIPSALFTFGSAVAAVTVGRLSQRYGRRPGLAAGYAAGAVGSVAIIIAAVLGNIPLLFAALLVYGSGTATNLQARYAGADLAHPDHRARAISTVLVATTLGAVAGPNLVDVLGGFAETIGVPRLAGPFLLAAVAYGAAAVVIATLLRPDPLRVAATLPESGEDGTRDEPQSRRWPPAVIAGATVMMLTQLVMVSLMTMTPVHMRDHHHGLSAAGLVISVHIAAMYLPAPISGALVDRYGATVVGVLAAVVLVAAGVTAALVPPHSVPALSIALALLGFGWSLGLVAGTTAIADHTPVATRAATQGAVDLGVAVAGAVGGLLSGLIVAAVGYSMLGVFGAVAAAAIVVPLLMTRR